MSFNCIADVSFTSFLLRLAEEAPRPSSVIFIFIAIAFFLALLAPRLCEETRLRQWQQVARVLCKHVSSFGQSGILQFFPLPSRRTPHFPGACCPHRPSQVQCMHWPGCFLQDSKEQLFRSFLVWTFLTPLLRSTVFFFVIGTFGGDNDPQVVGRWKSLGGLLALLFRVFDVIHRTIYTWLKISKCAVEPGSIVARTLNLLTLGTSGLTGTIVGQIGQIDGSNGARTFWNFETRATALIWFGKRFTEYSFFLTAILFFGLKYLCFCRILLENKRYYTNYIEWKIHDDVVKFKCSLVNLLNFINRSW